MKKFAVKANMFLTRHSCDTIRPTGVRGPWAESKAEAISLFNDMLLKKGIRHEPVFLPTIVERFTTSSTSKDWKIHDEASIVTDLVALGVKYEG